MGKSGKKQTVGYRYFLGMQQVYCHGPVDRLVEVRVDDRVAWTSAEPVHVTEDNPLTGEPGGRKMIHIDRLGLFGGEKREGGVRGWIDLEMGEPDQRVNNYLASQLGSLVPAFRGVVQLVLRQPELGMNPYLKRWSATWQRIFTRQNGIEQWYYIKAAVSTGNDQEVVIEDSQMDATQDITEVPSTDPSTGVTILANPQDTIYIDKPAGLTYRAWSVWDDDAKNDGKAWGNRFRVTVDDNDGSEFTHYNTGWFATQEEAENNFDPVVLTGHYKYQIWISDEPVDDNRGGLSIRATNLGRTDMNPAHIIRECHTDPDWGMGYPEAEVDDQAFTAAADQLVAEQMGMSLLWDRQSSLEEFVDDVVRHIDAAHFVDRRTGLLTLKLIRDDYAIEALPVLGPSVIERVEGYARPSPGDTVNQVTVRYWDARTRKTDSVSVDDPALVARDGVIINETIDYPGFTNASIASRAAARDLRALSLPLLSATLYCTSIPADLNIGDPFLFEWPELHDDPVVMRVLDIGFGDGRNNQVRIVCAEDVFALSDQLAIDPTESEWEDPVSDPEPAQDRIVIEAPYYELVQEQGQSAVDERLAEDPDIGFVIAAAASPTGDAINAAMMTDAGGGYEEVETLDFCPTARLAEAVGPVDTAWLIEDGVDLESVEIGQHCQIADELCAVTALDVEAGTMEVGRAVLDTVPEPSGYPAGTIILFWDDYAAADETEYATSEAIDVKLLTVTGSGQLDIEEAPADQVVIDQRAWRPYSPGNLQFNSQYFPDTVQGASQIMLTWAHRDRLQETAGFFVSFADGSVGPEPGVNYTVRIYGESDQLIDEATGISGAEFLFDESPTFWNSVLFLEPEAYWRLNDNSGTAAVDFSDEDRHGTYSAGAQLDQEPMFFGSSKAVQLTSGESVSLPDAPLIGGNNSRTMGFCCEIHQFDGITFLGGYGSSYSGRAFVAEIGRNGDGTIGLNPHGTGFQCTETAQVSLNTPHFIVYTYDGARLRIYVDGNKVLDEAMITLNTATVNGAIGDRAFFTQLPTPGLYSDWFFLDYPLTDEQVADLNDGLQIAPGDPQALSGRLRFELESVRDGVVSWQKHNVEIRRTGWYFNWDMYWDGGSP